MQSPRRTEAELIELMHGCCSPKPAEAIDPVSYMEGVAATIEWLVLETAPHPLRRLETQNENNTIEIKRSAESKEGRLSEVLQK